MSDYKWYAVYTRSRAEKKALKFLEDYGVEAYLPIIRKYRKWSDRVKAVDVPLLPSYIFVKVSEKEYYDVLNSSYVVCYITFEGKAAPIPENQINNLRLICGSEGYESVEVEELDFQPGEHIMITHGDFAGFKGEIVYEKSSTKLVVRLENLTCSIVVVLSAAMVDKIKK